MTQHPTFGEALRFWLKLGLISFGGPTGQIAIMHQELVERRRWVGEGRFLHALNFCMLLPGPEATQLATYCGWLLHRTAGGVAAGVLFILPSALLLWGLSWVYVAYGQISWVAAVFSGLKPAVTAIVADATIRIGQRALRGRAMWALAGASFVAIFFLHVPFPAIVLGAAVLGLVAGRYHPGLFSSAPASHGVGPAVLADRDAAGSHTIPNLRRAVFIAAVCLGLWWLPVGVAGWAGGWQGTLAQEGLFFSKAAVLTFGGAYAVLPYVAQQAVEHHGWLTATQMVDGLALAETTPGPLIMVVQFVGFLGAWNQPGTLPPLASATLGAMITTWTTFVPSFLFILVGAPYIERIRGVNWVTHALSAVTAAVVGVVANLAVWFAQHTLFPGFRYAVQRSGTSTDVEFDLGEDLFSIAVAVLAFVALRRFKAGIPLVIAACAAAGLARHLL